MNLCEPRSVDISGSVGAFCHLFHTLCPFVILCPCHLLYIPLEYNIRPSYCQGALHCLRDVRHLVVLSGMLLVLGDLF